MPLNAPLARLRSAILSAASARRQTQMAAEKIRAMESRNGFISQSGPDWPLFKYDFLMCFLRPFWHHAFMILTEAELLSLVQVQLRSPHQLLGMHPLGDGSGVVVRAFVPNAAAAEIIP